jgi:formylglycine-generating enzyme required for sulfatase activity
MTIDRAWVAPAVLALALLARPPAVGAAPQQPDASGERRFEPANTAMAWVAQGSFVMGCVASDTECFDDESPPRPVALAHGFWIDTTEVTIASYRSFCRATGRAAPPAPPFAQGDAHPVVNVAWDDAAAYCAWAGGRLPSEAEWEYAARAGRAGSKYPWGDAADHEHANYQGREGRDAWANTAPVASFEGNGFGLHDVAGNVWEWTADWYEPHPSARAGAAPPSGTLKVLRGGSYAYPPRSMRLSNRGKFPPTQRHESFGFRCVRDSGAATGEAPPATAVVSEPGAAAAAAAPTELPGSPTPPPVVAPALAVTPAPAAPSGNGSLQRRTFLPAGAEMVWVAPTTFEMGAVRGDGSGFGDEQPRHPVTLSRGFWIGATEVTFGQYRRFAEATGAPMPAVPNWADDTHPVVEVSWEQAAAYCRWAGGRLPSEAEWEGAARGGVAGRRYPGGAEISHDEANIDGTGGRDRWPKSAPVGSFPPNDFGVADVVGNASEWVADWYEERYYAVSPALDPTGPLEGKTRVIRGGNWGSDPGRLRTSYRFSLDPGDAQVTLGFRCARDGPP